ncbi:flagellar protein [Lachnospiraceae bacterium WCA-693-APC-MOT-I]|uniref:Flagellar protein n=2 Tax=Velocimicrobium porci TaxID=2606634 RepID=A0A6L5XWL2_9FIRM|nr:flagellar protein [Velocimicrobium porci]
MNISQNKFSSIEQMAGQVVNIRPKSQSRTQSSSGNKEGSFSEILKNKQASEGLGELKFSKHANQRLASRHIDLTKAQLERLENGTNKAREKGIRESLVMVDNLAFIVNIKNNTVVTAVNDTEEGVFTNIDGAVIS